MKFITENDTIPDPKPRIVISTLPAPLDSIITKEWEKEEIRLLKLYTSAPECHDANEKSVNAINTVLNSYMLRDYTGPDKETIIALLNIAQDANRAAITKARGQK